MIIVYLIFNNCAFFLLVKQHIFDSFLQEY